MRLSRSISIIILCLLVFSSQTALGQLGRIRINVVDSQGKPIEKVKIILLNDKAFNFKREIYTDKEGMASCVGLQPDVYSVIFEKEGYDPQKRNIHISVNLIQEEITLMKAEDALKETPAKDPALKAIDKYNEAVNSIDAKAYDKALALLKEAIALDENLYQAYFEIGKIYCLKNMYEEALAPLHKAISLKNDYAQAYKLLAASYEQLGKGEEAEKYSKKARELAGPSGLDKYNEAVSYLNKRDLDNAIPLLQEAVRLDPKLAEAYYELGMAFLNKGNKDGAVENLEKYLKLNPEGEKVSTAQAVLKAIRQS